MEQTLWWIMMYDGLEMCLCYWGNLFDAGIDYASDMNIWVILEPLVFVSYIFSDLLSNSLQ